MVTNCSHHSAKMFIREISIVIETSIGDLTIDFYLKELLNTCLNFLKLWKVKYYNLCIFHKVERNFIAQTGDPTSTARGGESIFNHLYGSQTAYFEIELKPRLINEKLRTSSIKNNSNNMNGSQFFFTLGKNLTYLDEVHIVFGEIVEGLETLLKIIEAICDPNNRPYLPGYQNNSYSVVLHDPYADETKCKNTEEIEEKNKENEAKTRATILGMFGDIPDADVKPPEYLLFVCKLNLVTKSEYLEIVFLRFGPIEETPEIRNVSSRAVRKKSDGYDMVLDMNDDLGDSKYRRCNSPQKYDENS
ncbi:peptidyl-prolyl cis-trans isomerase-like 4 [Nephila pilipes]|uniref:Peptidyl-prolyl cis-trans isomerase-like 4 n=1 Tax=Nephila pilipes TaxID=299642 RepID=A0A8X6NNJ6_NEPPI|nr:peptidyl-prolyl cis-trans isomerase-like 4 [Nephila pilipes]